MYRMPPGFGPQSMGPISQFGQMMPFRGGFPAARSAGFLSRFLSPNPGVGGGLNLIGMVENVQKVMKMADTVRPMIQQYGPMIKNFPSMLQLLKEYQSYSSDSSSDNDSDQETEDKPEQKKSSTTSGKKKNSSIGTTTSGKKTSTSGKKTSTSGKKTSKVSSGNQKSSDSGLTKKTKIKKKTTSKSVPQVKQISSSPNEEIRSSVPKLYI